ncbi:MAG: ABC transporter ATP-binding protein/permease, partial [Defluviitaleaceae bacterium]|nr:ABC transporter ATP-binding protein/permease [Defluviitaleaceae bacterium]
MSYLRKYWTKYKLLFFLSITCVSGEAICDLLIPKFMSQLINNGVNNGNMAYVLHIGLVMLATTGVGAVFAMTRNVAASLASQGFAREMRHDLFVKIQSLSLEEMDKFEGGSLVTRMTNDITQLQNFINGMMRIFFKAPVVCVGAIIMAATLDIRSIYVITPVVAVVGAVIAMSMRLTYPRFARVQQALDKLNTTMREYLAGIRLVKAFRRFEQEEKRFSGANETLTQNTVKASMVLAILSPCMNLAVNFGIAGIIFFGARWISAGNMQVGSITALVSYMTQILTSLGTISNVLNQLVRVKTSNERIREVMYIKPPEKVAELTAREERLAETAAHIVFENVGFEYTGSTGQAALSGLSFSLEKGKTLGVIGPTGSGKSTLAALLMHFYDASRGEIRVSGIPMNLIPDSALRSHAAIVPQTAALFTGTIKDNILWGKEDATDAQIEAASGAAEAHSFISAMPEGYETMIGQSGVNLSGGQKQRVSIARALIREPQLLVLDDCTSALDVMTEAKVKRALRRMYGNMTCVLIT